MKERTTKKSTNVISRFEVTRKIYFPEWTVDQVGLSSGPIAAVGAYDSLPKKKKVFGPRFSEASTKRLELKPSEKPSPNTYDISNLEMCSSQLQFAPYVKTGSQSSKSTLRRDEQHEKRKVLSPHIKGGPFNKT